MRKLTEREALPALKRTLVRLEDCLLLCGHSYKVEVEELEIEIEALKKMIEFVSYNVEGD